MKLSRGSGACFAPEAPADLGAGRVAGRIETYVAWRIWITFLGIFGVAPQGENPYESVVRTKKEIFRAKQIEASFCSFGNRTEGRLYGDDERTAGR